MCGKLGGKNFLKWDVCSFHHSITRIWYHLHLILLRVHMLKNRSQCVPLCLYLGTERVYIQNRLFSIFTVTGRAKLVGSSFLHWQGVGL